MSDYSQNWIINSLAEQNEIDSIVLKAGSQTALLNAQPGLGTGREMPLKCW